MARVLSTVAVLAFLHFSALEARADEFGGASASALGLAGAQVASKDDPAAALANPAGLGEDKVFVGAVLDFALVTSGLHPGIRAAYSKTLGEKLRLGVGVMPRRPLGCYFGCGAKAPGNATLVNYEATLAVDYLALDEPEGERLAFSLGYRPHFTFAEGRLSSGSGGSLDYSGSSFGALGFVLGVLYSPFEEVSFGFTLESGSERNSLAVGNARVVGALAPSAKAGAEIDVDRFLVRVEYALVGSSLVPELVVSEAGFRRVFGSTETVIHELRVGGAERFPFGRNELAIRVGASIRSNPGASDSVASRYLPIAAPVGGVSLGASIRTRESEWSLGVGYRNSLGNSNYPAALGAVAENFSEMLVALDASFDLSR